MHIIKNEENITSQLSEKTIDYLLKNSNLEELDASKYSILSLISICNKNINIKFSKKQMDLVIKHTNFNSEDSFTHNTPLEQVFSYAEKYSKIKPKTIDFFDLLQKSNFKSMPAIKQHRILNIIFKTNETFNFTNKQINDIILSTKKISHNNMHTLEDDKRIYHPALTEAIFNNKKQNLNLTTPQWDHLIEISPEIVELKWSWSSTPILAVTNPEINKHSDYTFNPIQWQKIIEISNIRKWSQGALNEITINLATMIKDHTISKIPEKIFFQLAENPIICGNEIIKNQILTMKNYNKINNTLKNTIQNTKKNKI
jgi:hypothetical protein